MATKKTKPVKTQSQWLYKEQQERKTIFSLIGKVSRMKANGKENYLNLIEIDVALRENESFWRVHVFS